MKLSGVEGERVLPLTEFYTGFMTTALAPGELVTEILVPKPKGEITYVKLGRRQANTPAIVSLAAHLVFDGEEMPLDPDTAAVVGFHVPEGTADGTYTVEVHDGIGVLEVITILPLLRRRSASTSLVVGAE